MRLLFDLDGTLTDPFVGITKCIQHALRTLGRNPPSADDLRWCIGPPLHASFLTLLETTDRQLADEALGVYRESKR
jgi:phosphoglycolate phosphatase